MKAQRKKGKRSCRSKRFTQNNKTINACCCVNDATTRTNITTKKGVFHRKQNRRQHNKLQRKSHKLQTKVNNLQGSAQSARGGWWG